MESPIFGLARAVAPSSVSRGGEGASLVEQHRKAEAALRVLLDVVSKAVVVVLTEHVCLSVHGRIGQSILVLFVAHAKKMCHKKKHMWLVARDTRLIGL